MSFLSIRFFTAVKLYKEKIISYRSIYYIIGTIIAIIPIIYSMLKGEIFCDSAYYICHAQLVARGLVPYHDFCFGYTPLWLYIAAALKLLFSIPDGNYVSYLILHYFFVVGNALLIYKISRKWDVRRDIAFIGFFLYIIMSHWLQGNVLLLEVPSTFFGLWACYLLIASPKNSWIIDIISGLICSCAFLCKQYGLGFLPLCLFLTIITNRKSWKNVILFLLGYSVLIIGCFLYWGQSLWPIIFSGYGTQSAIDAGWHITFGERIRLIVDKIAFFMFWACPTTIISLFYIHTLYINNRIKLKRLLFCYCGIFGFGLQFYFAQDFHYYLYLAPFGILVLLLIIGCKDKLWLDRIKWMLVIWTIIFSTYKTYKCRIFKWYTKEIRKEQYETARKISGIIPNNSCTWFSEMQYLYLLTNTLPPNLSTIGFSFGPLGINEELSLKQAHDASYVIITREGNTMYADTIRNYLNKNYHYSTIDTSLIIYDKTLVDTNVH